jgi:hypothetical protein
LLWAGFARAFLLALLVGTLFVLRLAFVRLRSTQRVAGDGASAAASCDGITWSVASSAGAAPGGARPTIALFGV